MIDWLVMFIEVIETEDLLSSDDLIWKTKEKAQQSINIRKVDIEQEHYPSSWVKQSTSSEKTERERENKETR